MAIVVQVEIRYLLLEIRVRKGFAIEVMLSYLIS